MKRKLLGRDLAIEALVGGFVVLVAAGLVYFTFAITGREFRQESYRIQVAFDEVMGLRENDMVMARGMPVGKVDSLRFASDRVLVELLLREKLNMRQNYTISIQMGSVFGGRHVRIEEGTRNFDSLSLHQCLIGEQPRDPMADMTEILDVARQELTGDEGVLARLRDSADHVHLIVQRVERGEGLMGRMLAEDDTLYEDIQAGVRSLNTLLARVERGEGLVGKLMDEDETLYKHVHESVVALNKITTRLEEGKGLLGRLLAEDDTLYLELEATLHEARGALDDLRETTPIVTFTSVLFGAF